VVTLRVPNRSAKAELLMDAIDALDRATQQIQEAEKEDQAIPSTEAISVSLPEKTNQAEDHEETGKFAHWFPLTPKHQLDRSKTIHRKTTIWLFSSRDMADDYERLSNSINQESRSD
jgi:hypothetical protein